MTKEEQAFWDSAFLVALGKTHPETNSIYKWVVYHPFTTENARKVADHSLQIRRSLTP